MAKQYLTNLDLNKNELLNGRLHNLAGAPSAPAAGQVYFDTTAKRAYIWNGSMWLRLSELTEEEVFSFVVLQAGSGTGLDADLVDGLEAAQLLARGNHTGTQPASTISNFDAQVRTSRLDQMAAPTSPLSAGGQRITNLATPTGPTDAVTKAYADGIASGIDFKQEVRAASTANVNIATHVGAIDGVAIQQGDRVLLRAQTATGERKIYTYNGAGGGFTPAADFSQAQSGAFVYVLSGPTYAGTAHVWNSDSLVWTQFSGASSLTAGDGLVASGNEFRIGFDPDGGILVEPDFIGIDFDLVVRKAVFAVGGATSQVLTHNLSTRDVTVSVARATAPYDVVECDVEATSVSAVTLRFAVAPAANAFRATVHG